MKPANSLERDLFDKRNNYYQMGAADIFSAEPLCDAITTKTAIIGGGYAGLAVAMGLLERGQSDIVLLESNEIGFGASGRNGGFVFGGYSLDEATLLKKLGNNTGRWAYQITTEAVDLIRHRINQHDIACDMVEGGVILANWFNDLDTLPRQQAFFADQLETQWQYLSSETLSNLLRTDRYSDGLLEPNAFHFHPLKYAKHLARLISQTDAKIYEKTPAIEIKATHNGYRITTPQAHVNAEQVVLACGGYFNKLHPHVARAVLPISTYIMVTEPLESALSQSINTQAAIYDTRFAFDYYRPLPDTRLLWGGRISIKTRDPAAVTKLLRRDLGKVYPELVDAKIDYAWGGRMGYTRHQMPIIGQSKPNLWHITGFGGHGVAPTTAFGELVAEAIAHKGTDYQPFNRFPRCYAGGYAGLAAAQLTYWALQTQDWIQERLTS